MAYTSKVILFLDDETTPIGEYDAPVNFELNTLKMTDGQHHLRIVSQDPTGKEGIRIIPFTVRNGPAIAVEGLNDNDVVDGVLPVMVNAYGKGNQKQFLIDSIETPKSVPSWLWATIIGFMGWAAYYFITSMA